MDKLPGDHHDSATTHTTETSLPVPVDVRMFLPALGTSPRGSASTLAEEPADEVDCDTKSPLEETAGVFAFPGTPTVVPPLRRSVKRRIEFTADCTNVESVPVYTRPADTTSCDPHWDPSAIRVARDERMACNRLIDATARMTVETVELIKSTRVSSDALTKAIHASADEHLAMRAECNALLATLTGIHSRAQKQHGDIIAAVTAQRAELNESQRAVTFMMWACVAVVVIVILLELNVTGA